MRVFPYLISLAEFCGLALVDTWRFSKSTWSLDRQVTWNSRWAPFTLTHNPTKFDGHWGCETWDAPFYKYNVITWLDGCSQLNLSHILLKLVTIVLEKVEIKLFINVMWSHDQWVVSPSGSDTLSLNHKDYSQSNGTQ